MASGQRFNNYRLHRGCSSSEPPSAVVPDSGFFLKTDTLPGLMAHPPIAKKNENVWVFVAQFSAATYS
jgi:hypothetical protein